MQSAGKLEVDMVQRVQDFIAANKFPVSGDNDSPSKKVGDGLSPEKRTKKVVLVAQKLSRTFLCRLMKHFFFNLRHSI